MLKLVFIENDETLNALSYVAVVPTVLQCVPIDQGEVAVQLAGSRSVQSLKGVKSD